MIPFLRSAASRPIFGMRRPDPQAPITNAVFKMIRAFGTIAYPLGLALLLAVISAFDFFSRHFAEPAPQVSLSVHTSSNRLTIALDQRPTFEFPIVTGKGITAVPGRGWVDFNTPKGQFRVRSVVKNPGWYRSDWVWQEKGKVPPTRAFVGSRVLFGRLGDSKICWGDGYCIHGTPSGSITPGPFSHGCIRMNREDLAELVRWVKPGTPIEIKD